MYDRTGYSTNSSARSVKASRRTRVSLRLGGLACAIGAMTSAVSMGSGPAFAAGSPGSSAPVTGIASTPDGKGYWEVASDGGIFAFGDAGFYGSMGGKPLNAPVVGIRATPDGKGYWEVASDGGIFAFGDAGFYGSMGGKPLNAGVVGISAARTAGATGRWPPTAESSPSATPASTAPWAARPSTPPWSASGPPPTGRATGRWPPTGGSSPSATPASTAPWAASPSTPAWSG